MNVFQKNACLLGLVMRQMPSDGGGSERPNPMGPFMSSAATQLSHWSETLWGVNIGEIACEDKDPDQPGVWNHSQQVKAESGPVVCLDLK